MITNYAKRILSALLVLVMVFSMVPAQAFAEEKHDHDHGDSTAVTEQQGGDEFETPGLSDSELTIQSQESAQMLRLRVEAAQYIDAYGLNADMPDSVLRDLYSNLYGTEQMAAMNAVEQMLSSGSQLSNEEQAVLLEEQNTKLVLRFYEVIRRSNSVELMAAVENYSKVFLDGAIQVDASRTTTEGGKCETDDATGAVVVTVTGYTAKNSCGGTDNKTTNATVYIKNTSGKKGTVTFKWSNSGLTLGTTLTAGTHSVVIDADASLAINLTSPSGNASGTFTLSDFTYEALQGSNNVTFVYADTEGTVTIDGTTVAPNAEVSVPLSGATLKAVPATGYAFVAWVDGEDKLLSQSATYQFAPETPMTVKALFTAGDPVFLVDKTYMVKGLNEAMAKGKLAVLMNDATLPQGEYVIPAGKTLQIPFDAANTLCTDAPVCSTGEVKPSAYRTLTMAAGAHITVEGAMSLSGSQVAGGTNAGIPKGPLAFVKMAEGSNITVKDGGNLYAWGYITGSGSVTIKDGGSVYEDFQVTCWRGGTNTSGLLNNKQRVFPMSQYYIQNVEVPMTLEAGAVEYGYMSINVTLLGIQSAKVPFIGPDGMFNVTSGSITKDYMENTDRLEITVNGSVQMKSLSMSMATVGTIDSSKYDLPVNSNITVHIMSDSIVEITQNIAMLPGTEMYVDDGANVTLGNEVKIFIYDAAEWAGKGFAYAGSDVRPLSYAPGRTGAAHKADTDAYVYVGGTLDASQGYVYTTASGANITAAEEAKVILKSGTQTVTYQITQTGSDGKTITYVEVPITPAKLKNADTGYTETAALPYAQYTYTNGVWVAECLHGKTTTTTVDATCTEDGATTVKCDNCDYSVVTVITATGHTAGAAATCTTAQTCTKCDYVYVAALGHAEVNQEAKDATCTASGWNAYVTCSRCDYTTKVEIPALGHDEVHHAARAVTCTEIGWDAYVTCSRCDYTTYQEISAKGHTRGAEATCTTDQTCTDCNYIFVAALGHTAGAAATCTEAQVCTVCNAELNPALGHDEVSHAAKAATCTEIGWNAYVTCSRCDYTTYVEIPALGHDEIVDTAVPATCTKPGEHAGSHCSRCDYMTGGGEIAPLGHDHVGAVTTDPTCTEAGVKTYTCSRNCGEEGAVYTEPVVALGHTAGAEATCTEAQVCTVCNAELAAAQGHTPGAAATCTEAQVCTVCNAELASAMGHTPGAAATCTEAQVCTICNAELTPAMGHGELREEELIPAMCEEDGHEEGKICTVCNEYVEGGAILPATGHKLYKYDAKIPTYTLPGWDAYERCSQCAYTTYVEIPKVPTPHITTYESFIQNLAILEQAAQTYALEHPGTDPLNLVIKYIRTGVERYNSGSWNIMAGYEDAGFRKFADEQEDLYNQQLPQDMWVGMSSLKYIDEFILPNGDQVDFGHMFGTMDITYHNNCGVNHADVGGWSGDLVDLLTTSSNYIGDNYSSDLETTVKFIRENYLFKMVNVDDKFSATDWYGDADGFYLMQKLASGEYEAGDMVDLMQTYFTTSLTDYERADFLIRNRFSGVSTRQDLRNAVYNAYTGNKTISTLEATRDFEHSGTELNLLRKAVCYAFADYLCQTAGDYVDVIENPYYEVFDSKSTDLAPGITQQINYATSADGKQMAYYLATADLRNPNVHVYANYASRDPKEWAMARVLDQANNMQDLYGNPESEQYVENFNVIASINAGGYDMSNGDPGGLLVMHGDVYKPIGSGGFFAITKEGKAILGATSEWDKYKDQVEEAIGGFGTLLVKDGKIAITANSNYYSDRAPRSAVGITATGKVVFMVLDGRQEPFSCGGSMIEIAQIMFDAGCVDAINLDGGGSSTFVARQPGDETLAVMNRPSDGAARSVSTSLVMASTAPSSTAFDHANLVSATKFVTIGTSLQITAEGISATGNAAELPEGLTWVIDENYANWASIDENGLFTARDRLGAVEVKLMLEDKVVGRTTITVVEPDQIYFTKTTLSAVYGQTIELPIKVLYQGKEVTVNSEDVVISVNSDVGTVDGFNFTAKESSVKNVKITAVLASNEEIKANATINLYKQGENSFDFDQATSGDRLLAWLRTVSNSTTDDNVNYTVVDPEQEMVTSYVLAMDMSQIPVPAHLEDLIYMLPGADMADASAWGFLMQLAERISPMTTVTPKIVFDSRVDVDISEMKLMNDYFEITGSEFDEVTNTLSLKLNWIDQTAALDPATANPLCMVSGIKVTPKADADWGNKDTLNIVHVGDISYDIYMRASGLYTFAQKPENQQMFGLYDYVNPNDPADRGGHFMSTYAKFEDSYTLVNVAKDGWVNEAGGFAYYVDGERLTGVQKIDGLYYGFDENGINVGQLPYSGLFQADGKSYYAIAGELQKGWFSIDDVWHFFDWSTGAGRDGSYTTTMAGIKVTYEMDNGRLVKGFWYDDGVGRMYFEGPHHIKQGWKTIDGKQYLFRKYYAYTGICPTYQSHDVTPTWYEFDKDGALIGDVADGMYWYDGELYYVTGGQSHRKGVYLVDGCYYYFNSEGVAVRNQTLWISNTNGLLTAGTYRMGSDGKIIMNTELVNENGTLYYYKNGLRTANAGMLLIDGSYYYVGSGAIAVANQSVWVSKTNGYFTAGTFRFGADGKLIMTTEIVNENGTLYYYKNGRRTASAGLVEYEGAYYHIDGAAKAQTNVTVWVSKTNGLWPVGSYTFGADGKMIIYNGIVNGYYYVDGIKTAAGLIYVDGNYYYAEGGGKLVTNKSYWISKSNNLLTVGTYRFDAEGKIIMTTELVDENGTLYYYQNGLRTANAGMLLIDGNYYYIGSGAIAATSQSVWVSKTNGYFTAGTFRFDAESKLILETAVVDENGTLYYYKDGRRTASAGLVEYEGAYYHIDGAAKAQTNVTVWVSKTNGLWPVGSYTFGADGKMIINNGVVDGYYYVNGIKTAAGLIYEDGNYYYAEGGGKLVTNKSYWISKSNNLLTVGTYRFDAEGKIIMTTELVDENGTLYYYQNGLRTANAGMLLIDGAYYYIASGAKAITNQRYWCNKNNGLMPVGSYTFGADGKMILD